MTAPAAPAAPPPTTIRYAVGALLVAGVAGVIASLLHSTSAWKTYTFTSVQKADHKSSDAKTRATSDATIHHDINSSVVPSVILSIVILVILGYIAYSAWKGRYWTRWATLGIFALMTVFLRTEGGLDGVLLVTTNAPAVYRIVALISSLALVSAVIATNVRPSLVFLSANRPVRAARPGGGLFGPRPPAGSTPRTKPATKPGREINHDTSGDPSGNAAGCPAGQAAPAWQVAPFPDRRQDGLSVPTALITGATAGLGAAFAGQLAAEGYDLVLVARDEQRLAAAKTDLEQLDKITVETIAADLTTASGRDAVAARIDADEHPVELLVNNAGIGLYRGFGKAELVDEDGMLDLNVRAVMHLAHAAVGAMRRRGRGMIVNIASVGGLVPRPETVTYGASKAYVIAFSEALAKLLAGTGVTVTAICPGFVHTEFHERAQVDMSYLPQWMWLDADDVVREGLADARKGKPVSIPNLKYKAIVGAARVLPRSVTRRMGASGKPKSR